MSHILRNKLIMNVIKIFVMNFQFFYKMVNAKTAKKVLAAKRFLYSTPGVNKDRLFQPDALKQPTKTT